MKKMKLAHLCALSFLCISAMPAEARDGQPTRQERLVSAWILTQDPYYARLAGLSEDQIAKTTRAKAAAERRPR